MKKLYTGILLNILFLTYTARAQYWQSMVPVNDDKTANAFFSNDEKSVFFTSGTAHSLQKVEIKSMKSTEVAAEIPRALPCIGRNYIVVMKNDASGNMRLWRMNADGSEPLDLTPTPTDAKNEIIGASFNGRYIYYSSSVHKTDYYRYDIQQNISELIVPNDKDYKLLSWSRDQKRLLLIDPMTSELFVYEIETLERLSILKPPNDIKIISAAWSADNKLLYVLSDKEGIQTLSSYQMTSPSSLDPTASIIPYEGIHKFDITTNGRFLVLYCKDKTIIYDLTVSAELTSGADIIDVRSNPRESHLVITKLKGDGNSIAIFDVIKKSATEIIPQ